MISERRDSGVRFEKSELASFLLGSMPRRIHLIGVAGSGMSGIAALLLALGHRVSGSDKVDTREVERLRRKGLEFESPHGTSMVSDAELVIFSSAIHAGNPAFDAALALGKPMARRAEVLAAVMTGKQGVVVCGMHGKTTTSAMAAHVLRAGGLKPSHYVGAEIPILGTNARWDSEGLHLVAEGDESDGTLIHYHPRHALVLNIEPEHLDHYRDLAAIDAVFSTLLGQTSGKVYYWADDPGAARLCATHPGAVPVGAGSRCEYRLGEVEQSGLAIRFAVFRGGEELGLIHLGIPGVHNAQNALLVIALATDLGIGFSVIASALENFRGAKRRFELRYQDDEFRVFDDYGHHPTEIAATLATARIALHENGGDGRLIVLFQPHRYSRTASLKTEFGRSFGDADLVFVAPIYPAGEAPIPGVDEGSVVEAARAEGHQGILRATSVLEAGCAAAASLQEGDLVITLGAGNIHEAGALIARELAFRARIRKAMGPGVIRISEPLSRHTTMRVGGPARFWVEPESEEGFAELVRLCHDEGIPFMVMGRGSNLIVRDGGFPGVVAHLSRGCFAEASVDGNEVIAGVGARLKQLAAVARNAGLAGFEWMDGIPGNLGGALRMNAGAMGVQTFDQVVRIRFADRDGNIVSRAPQELEVRYRDVPVLHDHYALSATLSGTPADIGKIDGLLGESLRHRKETQPVAASAGCIFKNPGGISAGKLIDELGLKNSAVGGARVSEVHANFIVNDGGATAGEILALIGLIQDRARLERGIELETEVSIIGEEPEDREKTHDH
jgi:UDP-N-acetylmuramate--L-alanine ligase/UDP-N-acetylenolpyruvoylglucosamine reductase